jgi:hypothetical protein
LGSLNARYIYTRCDPRLLRAGNCGFGAVGGDETTTAIVLDAIFMTGVIGVR